MGQRPATGSQVARNELKSHERFRHGEFERPCAREDLGTWSLFFFAAPEAGAWYLDSCYMPFRPLSEGEQPVRIQLRRAAMQFTVGEDFRPQAAVPTQPALGAFADGRVHPIAGL